MVTKIEDISKINRSSDDIWKLIKIAVDSKNWALLHQNLNRLHALQGYYCRILTIQSSSIRVLEASERYYIQKNYELEDEWMKMFCSSRGQDLNSIKNSSEYSEIKKRLNELFQES